MSIKLNDNIKINAGKPSESKYLSTGNTAYITTSAAMSAIPLAERHLGLTVLIASGTSNLEFWWKKGVEDTDLIEKKFSSEQVVGDFITGATNLGYFSGRTGIQKLTLSGFPTTPVNFDGEYYSEYNWYYSDADGIIRIGSPTFGGPLRRAYVDATRTKSWIYDVSTSAWILSNNDVSANVGNSILDYTYGGSGYTETEWTGFTSNGLTSIDVDGSLTTGNTLTIGNPNYRDKDNQNLNIRSIISDTPKFIKIITDENYTRFSGTSSVLSASNHGGGVGVYSGQSDNNLQFRTLVQSGDTSIIQKSDGRIIIYSSSDGSAEAITGVTNIGTGVSVYSGTTDRNIALKSFVGSGDTTVVDSGDTIIIGSTGGGGGTVFTEDITVSIANGKTFGRYENGDVIPASGKTPNEVILLSLTEPLEPTVNLTSPINDVRFGLSTKTVSLNFSYTINTAGASVVSTVLEWNRGGAWIVLDSDTGSTSYPHSINDSGNRFNTDDINYRYTVIDSEGASGRTTISISPETYQTPNISPTYTLVSSNSYESYSLREVGNVNTRVNGTISARSLLVNIVSYEIQRNDGSGYVTIASDTGINLTSVTIPELIDSGSASDANTISYQIVVVDEYQSTTGGNSVINLDYASYFGYNTNTTLSGPQIAALGNEALLSSPSRILTNVSAGQFEYTYISYPATFPDITSIIQNGSGEFLGSFTKLSDVTVPNFYGESVTNKVYVSNAPNAFTGVKLDIS